MSSPPFLQQNLRVLFVCTFSPRTRFYGLYCLQSYNQCRFYVGFADTNFPVMSQPQSQQLSEKQDSCNDPFADDEDFYNAVSSNNGLNAVSLLFSLNVRGLDSDTNGHCCIQHEYCRHHVRTRNVLYFSGQLQTVDRSGSSIPFSFYHSNESKGVGLKREAAPYVIGNVACKKHNNNKPLSNIFLEYSEPEEEAWMEEFVKLHTILFATKVI
jgi:hypothetical protein